jgi:hypothetical protein
MDVGEPEMLTVGAAVEVVDVVAVVDEVVEVEETMTFADTMVVPEEFVAVSKYVVDCEGVTVADPCFATVTPLIVTEFAADVFQDSTDDPPWPMVPGEAEIVADGDGLPVAAPKPASE